MNGRYSVYAIFSTMFWGLSFTFIIIKIGLEKTTPIFLVF